MHDNHFLGSLTTPDLELLRPDLETVELERDEEIATDRYSAPAGTTTISRRGMKSDFSTDPFHPALSPVDEK